MNCSFKRSSGFLPLLITHRGFSYSWLLNPRNLRQYNVCPRNLSAVSHLVVTDSKRNLHHFQQQKSRLSNCQGDDRSICKFKHRNFCSFSRTLGVRSSSNQSSFRHYSQGNPGPHKFDNATKFLATVLSVALGGGVVYKLFLRDKQSEDTIELKHDDKLKDVQNIHRYPVNSKDIPENVPYLLIGGGTTAFSAFRAIKAIDSTAKVLMVTDEPYYPYMRPPLSKELIVNKSEDAAKTLSFIQWDGSERSVYYEPEEFYISCQELNDSETGGVSVVRGWKVTELNPDMKYVVLADGKKISYNKCLLATGALPKNLPVFSNSTPEVQQKVILYRNLRDYVKLENGIEKGLKSVLIVGGGFNGSELACSLARRGLNVTQVYKESGNMAQVLPEYLSQWVTKKLENQGIKLYKNTEVKEVKMIGNQVNIVTNTNESISADQVIVAAGVEANTGLASSAGLEVDETFGGYVVNAELQARNDLFVAGDCACFYDKKLGRRRVEHHDHAVVSGRLAGENMTGAGKPFVHQSMFWSDLGPGLGYEAIGIIDSSLPTVSVYLKNPEENKKKGPLEETGLLKDSSEEYRKGIIFYLRNNIVVGMVMWNLFNRIGIARQVLKSDIRLEDLKEAAKLFSLNENV